ncbi:MAG: prolyl oligopeptidase family serine peptidase [Bacteroidia bacterium]|nr:prolyl oligopeptidase family serine peptidase [Bacteroidia bacterium]
MRTDYSFQTSLENEISLSLYSELPFGQQPCVIYIHGFKGFKDWAFVPHVGKQFAENGLAFLCFNFSHNGIGEDMERFTELEKFEQDTYSLQLAELREIIQATCHTDFFGGKAHAGLGLLGHSRGGGVALLAASQQAEIQGVCTWAGISSVDRYSKSYMQDWEKKGYTEVKNSRTGQVLKMGTPMLKDIQKNGKKSLNILNAVKSLEVPLMIIHGQKDTSVPPHEAEQLSIFANASKSSMRMIPNANHTFGAVHPFAGSTPSLDMAIEQSIEFFRAHLS